MNTTILLIISILMSLPPNTHLQWNNKVVTPQELVKEIRAIYEPAKPVEKKSKVKTFKAVPPPDNTRGAFKA